MWTDDLSSDEKFQICIEDLSDGRFWHQVLSKTFIEDITEQAGSFKTLSAFLKMLKQALLEPNENLNVFIMHRNEEVYFFWSLTLLGKQGEPSRLHIQ